MIQKTKLSRWFGSLLNERTEAKPKRSTRASRERKMLFESLERREVFSTDLLSAFAYGNDTGGTLAKSVAVDVAGNSYMSGAFSGTVDFDPSMTHVGDTDILTARGSQDAYVAKYAPDNSLIWAHRMGGDDQVVSTLPPTFNDIGNKVKVDTTGNVFVVGSFKGAADFGSITLITNGELDGYLVKFDSNGVVQWAKQWGGQVDELGNGLALDGSNNVYVQGIGSSSNLAERGIDILKLNTAGTQVWSKKVNSNGLYSDLAVDAAGNVFSIGTFSGTVDFDPSPKTNWVFSGNSSVATGYVLKLSSQGNFSWVSPFQSQGLSYAISNSVAIDGTGNVIVGGSYYGAVDFNPGIGVTTLPNKGAFITKLNSNGSLVWAKPLEQQDSNGGTTVVTAIAIGPAGSINVAGSFSGTTDFDPGVATDIRTSAGGQDAYILNLNSSGGFGWMETFGGTQNDQATGIAVDAAGTIYVAGYFNGTVDFDPSLGTTNLSTSGSGRYSFLARFRRS